MQTKPDALIATLRQKREKHTPLLLAAFNDLKATLTESSNNNSLPQHINYINSLIKDKNILLVDLNSEQIRTNLVNFLTILKHTERYSDALVNVAKLLKGQFALESVLNRKEEFFASIGDTFVSILDNIIHPEDNSQKQLMSILTNGILTFEQYDTLSKEQKSMIFPDGQVSLEILLSVDLLGIQEVLASSSQPVPFSIKDQASAAIGSITSFTSNVLDGLDRLGEQLFSSKEADVELRRRIGDDQEERGK
jgi:hypothetical protein